jgi:uncharacterized protein (TIGR00251 family)
VKLKVHTNSSQEKIVELENNFYGVWLKEKPVDGKANLSLLKLLKKEFGKNFKIKSGFNSLNKIVEEIS